ncbi:magnesium transporter MRS2-3 [Selaginella moellendorffii]|uniref:magnesium transporter MRS2-3 n=1 Tax=Selaginella moellendorffii TaxID=88036 RepID=UPI000D1C3911|nr:magnesium transporter MRS2-3 [Selaginella moellendorffii]|eukprot:XP_024541338.1 magnesium transporter MRS2-3 [Selaginella moellendorffii]
MQHLRHRGGGGGGATPLLGGADASIAAENAEFKAASGRTPMGMRKKGMGVRMWLVINSSGVQRLEAGKHAIMRRTSLPARDLRILDPLLSYPSTILGRERAIVVNLEHIKAIISAHEVLLLNSKDPLVAPFVDELRGRLPVHYNALGQQVPGDGGGGMSDTEIPSRPSQDDEANGSIDASISLEAPEGSSFKFSNDLQNKGGPSVLPFEFRALEACLEAACSCLDAETNALEQQAYPALDELTSKISTLNLERVRLIKSRLVAISGRVQKVRDEIEQLLDDDGDMAEMYLTDKLSRQQLDGVPSPPAYDMDEEEKDNAEENEQRLDERQAAEKNQFMPDVKAEAQTAFEAMRETLSGLHKGDGLSSSSRSSNKSSSSHSNHPKQNLDVEELEMLLEAYFVQIDGTLNKLSTLRDYVEDTEDYINIMLDDKQNHLLQMGVMLTTATLVVSGFIVVTGIFGMNIRISLFNEGTLTQFLWVVGGAGVGALLVYILVIGWCRYKRLLE